MRAKKSSTRSTIDGSPKFLLIDTAEASYEVSNLVSSAVAVGSGQANFRASSSLGEAANSSDEVHLIHMVDYSVSFDMDNGGVAPNRRVTVGLRWSIEGTKGSPFRSDVDTLMTCHSLVDSTLSDESGGRSRDSIVFSSPVVYPLPIVGIKQYQLWATSENVAGGNVPTTELVTVRAVVYYTVASMDREKLQLLRARMNRR
jgi:hypothetical protein